MENCHRDGFILCFCSTFFRRPDFSPDGKLVAFPTGCYEVEDESPADPDDQMIQINVVYVYQCNNLEE